MSAGYWVASCPLCCTETGEHILARGLCQPCVRESAERHTADTGHATEILAPPPERTTDNVQRLLRRVNW